MKERTALVVDDDTHIQLVLRRVLEELRFEVETASQGKEALKKIRRHPYHMVLLDLNLPVMNGLEVLRRLQQEQIPTRVVVITAYGTIERSVEAMQLGAADFVRKPFEPEDIRKVINRTLSQEEPWTDKRFRQCLRQIRSYLRSQHYNEAEELVHRALLANPGQAEVYNLLGILLELRGKGTDAQKLYRAALGMEPTYRPAAENLDRISSSSFSGRLNMGDSNPE